MVTACVALIAVLWTTSLFLPAWRLGGEIATGRQILASGCMGILVGQIGWFGNPFILAVCGLALAGYQHPLIMAPLAVGLLSSAVAAVLTETIMVDEGGGTRTIEKRYAGYYCWLAAVLLSALLAFYLAFR